MMTKYCAAIYLEWYGKNWCAKWRITNWLRMGRFRWAKSCCKSEKNKILRILIMIQVAILFSFVFFFFYNCYVRFEMEPEIWLIDNISWRSFILCSGLTEMARSSLESKWDWISCLQFMTMTKGISAIPHFVLPEEMKLNVTVH